MSKFFKINDLNLREELFMIKQKVFKKRTPQYKPPFKPRLDFPNKISIELQHFHVLCL